jgi:hypothetical protein
MVGSKLNTSPWSKLAKNPTRYEGFLDTIIEIVSQAPNLRLHLDCCDELPIRHD